MLDRLSARVGQGIQSFIPAGDYLYFGDLQSILRTQPLITGGTITTIASDKSPLSMISAGGYLFWRSSAGVSRAPG